MEKLTHCQEIEGLHCLTGLFHMGAVTLIAALSYLLRGGWRERTANSFYLSFPSTQLKSCHKMLCMICGERVTNLQKTKVWKL